LWFIRRRNKFFKSFTGWFIGSDSTREIKRPFAARDQTIEEAIKAKKISSCTIDPIEYTGESDKIIILKPTNVYMYQVQGQLHMTKRNQCYFVVYTKKDLKYGVVQKDDDFWSKYMVQQLEC
jgi:hypothetical protein